MWVPENKRDTTVMYMMKQRGRGEGTMAMLAQQVFDLQPTNHTHERIEGFVCPNRNLTR